MELPHIHSRAEGANLEIYIGYHMCFIFSSNKFTPSRAPLDFFKAVIL